MTHALLFQSFARVIAHAHVTRSTLQRVGGVVLLSLFVPKLVSAFQPDEARRQAQMERMRASAAAIDRQNADRAFQAGLARSAAGRSSTGSGSSSSSSGSSGSGRPIVGGGSGSGRSTGPQSVVATRTYRIFVGETMPQAAARLSREAAAGSAESQYLLGRMNYAGYGVPTNAVEARRLFIAAAVQKHVEANAYAGDLLVNGLGGPADITRGMTFLLAAAMAGNADAQALWGMKTVLAAFETNNNSQVRRGIALLELAADSGKALAQNTLGTTVYYYGVGGTAADSVKAVKYLRMGAAQGDPMSMYALGNLMVDGDPWTGLARTEGWALVSRAAQAGDGRAMWKLGLAKMNGTDGQQKDIAGGVRLMRQSAESGDRRGMFVYANMLYLGDGVPENKPEGIRYARLSAEANDGGAQLMLAKMNYFGDVGIVKSKAEAVRWSRLSAESGFPAGQMFYAKLLWTGDGLPQDRLAAARLIEQSAAQGEEEAITEVRDPEVQAILRAAPVANGRPRAASAPGRTAQPVTAADAGAVPCTRGLPSGCVAVGGTQPTASQPALPTDGFTVCSAFLSERNKLFMTPPFAAARSRSNELSLGYVAMLREKGYAAASMYAPAGSPPPALTVDCRWHTSSAQAAEFENRLVAGSERQRMTILVTPFSP